MILGVDTKILIIFGIISAIIMSMELFGKVVGASTFFSIFGTILGKLGKTAEKASETAK